MCIRDSAWNGPVVAKILDRIDYLGHTVNFKTHVKSVSYTHLDVYKRQPFFRNMIVHLIVLIEINHIIHTLHLEAGADTG